MNQPVTFASAAGPCAGWYHPAQSPTRRIAVVLCRPPGYEALCSYRTYTQLAQALAGAGFDVLRFDAHGTGDSAGDDDDSNRVAAWLASTQAAVETAKRLSGAAEVALFGLRLGANLALEIAAGRDDVASLMLWAPCASGRAFGRELKAAHMARELPSGATATGGVEALGMLYSKATLEGLQALDPMRIARRPAARVLVIARDDLPADTKLATHLAGLGSDVTATTWPGYAGMMAEPHDAVLAPDTLASITRWLGQAHPGTFPSQRAAPLAPPLPIRTGGVVETPVRFGEADALFGVLSEQAGVATGDRADTAVLFLNVGGNYRIGPNRAYVRMARALAAEGYRAFRFDVAGIGDSRVEAGFSSASMYRRDAVADVRAAIDALAKMGCRRFWVVGICSGSYLAFETALADSRVCGQVLMNPRLLEWDADRSGPWQSSMQQYYKSTRYYRRALLQGGVYLRLLRGDVDVRGITNRLFDLLAARVARTLRHALATRPPQEGVLAKTRHLCARGTDTLVVMSAQDDGLDYVEFHLGSRGARLRGQPNFRMELVEDADHTFSTRLAQDAVIALLCGHLRSRHRCEPAAPALAPLAATT